MTTSRVLDVAARQVAHALRHFPLTGVRFDPSLSFWADATANRAFVGKIDVETQKKFHARNWLLVLWNRQAVKQSMLRRNEAHVLERGVSVREFVFRIVSCDITFAMISPSLDLLEGVEEWFIVAGRDELCACPEVTLYPNDEKIKINPTVVDLSMRGYAYPQDTAQGTVTSLEMNLTLQYPALIRKDLKNLITEIDTDFYIQ